MFALATIGFTLLLGTTVQVGPTRGDEQRPAGDRESRAILSVLFDVPGRPRTELRLYGVKDGPDNAGTASIERALLAAFAKPPIAASEANAALRRWSVIGSPHFSLAGGHGSGGVDLAPLLAELHSQGINLLTVVVRFPPSADPVCIVGDRSLPAATGSRIYSTEIPTDAGHTMLAVSFDVRNSLTNTVRPPVTPGDPRRLWMLAAVPLAVLIPAWRLRRLARRPDVDVTTLGFRYWRGQSLLLLGTWTLWMVAVAVSGAADHVNAWFVAPGTMARMARWGLLYVLPPLACALLVRAVVASARDRLRELGWPLADLTGRFIGLQAASYAALLFVCLGVAALVADRAGRTGVLLLLAAIAVRIAAGRWARHTLQLTPVPLLHGELRDRVAALAARFGLREPQVGLLPSDRSRMVNAFAIAGGAYGIWITDRLLQEFSRREVDAVVAHELTHLRQHTTRRYGVRLAGRLFLLMLLVSAVFAGVAFLVVLRPPIPGGWEPWALVAGVVVSQCVATAVSRGKEFDADRGSFQATGDAAALITALTRLDRLNGLPSTWGRWTGLFLTHPPTARRVAALARLGGVSPDQLAALRAAPATDPERYAIPPDAVEGSLVFSTAFRRWVIGRMSWSVLGAIILLPALAAWLADLAGPGSFAITVLAVGTVLAFVA
jgi:heat shock protein HtpX